MLNAQPTVSAQLANLDASSLADFFGLITEAHSQMEQSLLMLQIDNADSQSLSELAMAVDNIHNALADHSLSELRELTSSLLQLIYAVRQRQMLFTTVVGDVILLAIQDIKMLLEKSLEGDASPALMHRLPRICVAIKNVGHVDRSMQESMMRDILLLLDSTTELLDSTSTAADSLRKLFSSADPDEGELRRDQLHPRRSPQPLFDSERLHLAELGAGVEIGDGSIDVIDDVGVLEMMSGDHRWPSHCGESSSARSRLSPPREQASPKRLARLQSRLGSITVRTGASGPDIRPSACATPDSPIRSPTHAEMSTLPSAIERRASSMSCGSSPPAKWTVRRLFWAAKT